MIVNPDLKILLGINSLVSASPIAAKLVLFASYNPLIRGFPVFFSLAALWFKGDDRKRARIAIGLAGVCLALAASVSTQMIFHWHLHPSIDPSIHLKGGEFGILASGYDRQYSFPSDTTNLFFALSTVVLLESRTLGCISLVWCLLESILRIALGCHYPSDILGGAVLGMGCVLLISRLRPLRTWFEGVLEHSGPRIYLIHAVFAFFLADAYNIFPGIIGVLKIVLPTHPR